MRRYVNSTNPFSQNSASVASVIKVTSQSVSYNTITTFMQAMKLTYLHTTTQAHKTFKILT